MHNDIEELISDNLSLRKSYQLAKSQVEKLEKDLKQQKEKYRDLNQNYFNMSDQNTKLQDKVKSLQAHLNNNNSSFVSQIEELKSLIEQKENEMQNFQLKMIPSLDQDMIRVKLIAEMEGPYQQTVEKKDRQIGRLKDQNHLLRRQKQIADFSLTNREREYKKQLQDLKNFYDHQIDRLTRQLSHFNQKTTTGKTEKDIIKSYRQQIDQLRSSCQFHRVTEEELRKQLGALRFERQRLLSDLMNANAQKAIQIKEFSNDGGLKEIKAAKARLEDQLHSSQRENQRLKSKIKSLEEQKNKISQKYEWELKDKAAQWDQQREKHRNQINEFKDEIRKIKQSNYRAEQQRLQLSQKYEAAVKSGERLSQQVNNLKIKLNVQESQQTSRYRRSEEVDRVTREKIQRQTIERVTKQLRVKIKQEMLQEERRGNFNEQFEKLYKLLSQKMDKQTFANFLKELKRKIREEIQQQGRRHGESPNRQMELEKNSERSKTKALQEKVKKLTQKLQFANSKILQLLKDKAKRSERQNVELARTRTYSYSPEHDYHRLLLENRDCSFVPMCPPVVVEHLQAKHSHYDNY